MRQYLIYIIGVALLLCGCKAKTTTVVETRTETKVQRVVELKTDTVTVEIPAQSREVTSRDTISRLETDFATSLAEILHDGSLHHTLANKARPLPVKVQRVVERVDSVAYVEKPVTIEVPAPLSWWQRFQISTWWWLAAGCLLAVLWLAAQLKILR